MGVWAGMLEGDRMRKHGCMKMTLNKSRVIRVFWNSLIVHNITKSIIFILMMMMMSMMMMTTMMMIMMTMMMATLYLLYASWHTVLHVSRRTQILTPHGELWFVC